MINYTPFNDIIALKKPCLMSKKAERLKEIRIFYSENQTDFGKRLGVSQPNIAKYEKGAQTIGASLEFRLLNILGINPVWWKTGEGEMFLAKKNIAEEPTEMWTRSADTPTKLVKRIEPYVNENLIKVPIVEIYARAGLVENLDNYSEYLQDHTYVFPVSGEKYEKAIAIRIDGDSMEPRLERGDVVLAFYQEKSEWEYLNPGVYAVVYRNSFVIKRIQKNTLQSTGTIELLSDNEIHGPISVRMEDIRGIWKVTRLIERRVF